MLMKNVKRQVILCPITSASVVTARGIRAESVRINSPPTPWSSAVVNAWISDRVYGVIGADIEVLPRRSGIGLRRSRLVLRRYPRAFRLSAGSTGPQSALTGAERRLSTDTHTDSGRRAASAALNSGYQEWITTPF